MGTAERERREAPEESVAARSRGRWGQEGSDPDIPVQRRFGAATGGDQHQYDRPLWVEEPARRHPTPDPVRRAAVRAVLVISVTLIQAMVAFLCAMAGSWPAFPMVISSVASTVVATWAVVDVWVTRQVWNQRHGVVSEPSSTARALRRERRARRRQERTALRDRDRIARRGGTGRLSHT
ncbi:hypothetical protein D9753_29865 [Streptomyces dangxiongensis]|uniref:Uncharacterized protein n=2 Tax=Streptomyces dangxiongensis TaxID=1442032 RepID=A0A3G2JNL2_9ACTN|nr:hypothetical protein [Streptomyces dangxiongensis]AYN43944.1 hypothetical protein D9753_29865 [Streptomyces dangxiongensis]